MTHTRICFILNLGKREREIIFNTYYIIVTSTIVIIKNPSATHVIKFDIYEF